MVFGKRGALLIVLSVLLLSSLASAAIVITPTKSLYNVGDNFDVNIAVRPTKATNDFFIATLVCEGRAIEFYKSPLKIAGGEEREISISTSLDNFIIAGISGDCLIRADYGDETVSGKTFTISGDVEVSLDIDVLDYRPGELVSLVGTAVKSNGESLSGFIDISVSGMEFSETIASDGGTFMTEFVIPENANAGSYEILVVAYEQDNNDRITNSGQISGTIKVAQVIQKVEVALNVETIIPENELSYTIVVYDQAEQFVEGEAIVVITNSEGFKISEALLKTSESNGLYIEPNFTPGDWQIYAKVQGVETTRKFKVEQYEKLAFNLESKILDVTNIGNIPYNGPIEISIGDVNEIKEIKDLAVGEVKRYKLVAPDGDYEIRVNTGNERSELGRALLTGNAISVEDVGGAIRNNLLVLVIIIVVLAILVVVVYRYRKKRKDKFIGKTSGSFTPTKFDGSAVEEKAPSSKVSSNVIDKGEKQESIVIALNVKNLSKLQSSGGEGLKVIDSALWKAKESGAKIYSDGNYRVVVLAPALTKSKDVIVKGLSVAEDLGRRLSEYNKRSKGAIEFGVGVNVGELIVESTGADKFRFISLDNTISAAKRVSQDSVSEVLLSEKARRKSAGKIKVTKKGALFRLEKITDRSAHADFISKFKNRQKIAAEKAKK